jgi:hypothetical protein
MSTCTAEIDYVPRLQPTLCARSLGADTQALFLHLAEQQALMTPDQLYRRQSELFGPQGIFADFSEQVSREGRQARVFADIAQVKDPLRLMQIEAAVGYALSVHHRRDASANPFQALSRESLCCVVYDESAAFTFVERYAAYEAIRVMDSDFFIKLIATTRGVVERRIVFHGLLEHFDRLLPVEKSIYPANYREVQQGHLNREQAIYGPLQLEKPLHQLLEDISPMALLERMKGGASFAGC